MRISLSHFARFQSLHITKIVFCLLLSAFWLLPSANAQRLEVHLDKDLSTNTIAGKAWGAGAAIELDQLVKKMTFRINFDWSMYRKKEGIENPNYQKMSGGISALYTFNIAKNTEFLCGLDLNYTHLKYSYIISFDTIAKKPNTLQHKGNFIGMGTHFKLQYKFTSRFNGSISFVPVYLFPISNKVSDGVSEPEYKKGLWLFPLRIGFSFLLFKQE